MERSYGFPVELPEGLAVDLCRRRAAQAEAPAKLKAIAALTGSIAPPPPPKDGPLLTEGVDPLLGIPIFREPESNVTGAGELLTGRFKSDGVLLATF